jgi:hypothetical protein
MYMKSIIYACAMAGSLFGLAAQAVPPQSLPDITLGETGAVFGDCGDFFVLTDYEINVQVVQYFNPDRSLKREFFKFRPNYQIFYNSEEPSFWLASNSDPQQRWLRYENDVPVWTAASNNFTVTAPGYGAVLQLHQRLTINFVTGEVSMKGPDDFSTGNFDAFCAALRASP